MKGNLLPCLILLAMLNPAVAAIITQWNYNSVPPDANNSTGTNVPSVGYGASSIVGLITASFSDGSTNDPASSTDDSGWHTTDYPTQGTSNKMAGVQFNVSTLDYSNIVVRWDQRVSGSASKYYRLQYSTDGATFNDYPTPIVAQVAASSSTYYEAQTNNLAAIPGVNNNPNFAFRIVSEWESTALGGTNAFKPLGSNYLSSGTVRFDYVTILGTLLPGANTPPYISTLDNQTIRVNQSTAPLSFSILDAEDPAVNLTLTKTSSDPGVIPPANVVFGGFSANRTVSVTAGTLTGSSTITVWVVDSGGKSNSAPFTVTVLAANTAPTISTIPATNTQISTAIAPLAFTVGDAETPASSLTLSATSANPGLVPDTSINFGGSGANRTVSATPAGGQIGVAPITVTVSDGTNTASSTFGLMVLPAPSVIFYDPFSYADGSVVINSGSLWENHTGTAGQCQVVNGQLQVTGTQTEDVSGTLAGAPYNKNLGIVLYAAFKAKFLSLPKTAPEYFADFIAGSAQRGRIFAGTPTNSPPGTFRLYVANGSDTNTVLAGDFATNTTYSLVTRYNIDTATTTLWVNPASESTASATATDPQSAVSVSAFSFRQDSGLGATILVDDLKVGLSFAAVTSTNVAITPIALKIQLVGGNAVLSWSDPSFGLQSSSTITGTFDNVIGATSPFTNAITGATKFFRLKAN